MTTAREIRKQTPDLHRLLLGETVETRAGTRYLVDDVAGMLGPVLTAAGVRVAEDLPGGDLQMVYCTRDGDHLTVDAVRDLVAEAFHDAPEALRGTLQSRRLYVHMREDGSIPTLSPSAPLRRNRRSRRPLAVPAYFAEYVEAWLAENVTEVRRAAATYRDFVDDFEVDFGDRPGEDGCPGKQSFYLALRSSGLVEERKRNNGTVLVPLDVEEAGA